VIAEVNSELGEAVATGIKGGGGEAIFIQTDVSDYGQCEQMVETTIKTYGRVDALVNNAAIYYGTAMRPHLAIRDEDWERHMAVNVKETFHCCKAVVPRMIKQGKGYIINMGSTVAMEGVPMLLDYVTSKGAIIAMTKGLGKEMPLLGNVEITVNCVCPGLTYTEASEKLMKNWSEARKAAYEESKAIKRMEMPSDLIGIITFLVSDASDYITGGTFPVDGGRYLH
jgi:3-oxoacyl-[acyl-carrier protein] reductase